MWGQCTPNSRIRKIKIPITIELTAITVGDVVSGQLILQRAKQPSTVNRSVAAFQLIFPDIASNEPIPEGQTDIDGFNCLYLEVLINACNFIDQCCEINFHIQNCAPPILSEPD